MQIEAKSAKAIVKEKKINVREKSEAKTSQTQLLTLLAGDISKSLSYELNGNVVFVNVFGSTTKEKDVYACTTDGLRVPITIDDCDQIKKGGKVNVVLAANVLTDANIEKNPSLLTNALDVPTEDGGTAKGFVVFRSYTIE